jgi:predicted  nucleic acid-binding Zn-ribbon protein
MFQEQQKVWQEELRRADERSSKHRKELSSLTAANSRLSEEARLLSEQVESREEEIARLQHQPQGTLDQLKNKRSEELLASLQKQNEVMVSKNMELV